jgi:membrane-bound metal-dependent hydrolase YbcI (DUF457 family)
MLFICNRNRETTMMGHTHALSGLAAGAATLGVAPVQGLREQLAWTACWGGMALLPDLDQRGTTSARMWGPISTVTARGVGWIARGHRQGTHDVLIAPVVFGTIAVAAADYRVGALVVLAVAIGLALHAVHFVIPGNVERSWIGNLGLSLLGAWQLTTSGVDVGWLPLAVAGGVVAHIAGDALTTERVPVPGTWLLPRKYRLRFGLAIADTNTWLEPVVSLACSVLCLWQLAVHTGSWPRITEAVRALTVQA